MLSKDFITAGKAVFTIEIPEAFYQKNDLKPHYTFRVRFKKGSGGYADAYFVSLLTGPDNTSSYSYIGMLDVQTGFVRATAKSAMQQDAMPFQLLNRTFARIWAGQGDQIEKAGFLVHHEGRCGRCGRLLTVPASISSGLGPECSGRLAADVRSKQMAQWDSIEANNGALVK